MKQLWTRDFTIITLGTVVSMVGAAISSFALSILVLDYTGSTFLYTLFLVCTNLPKIAAPLIAGPLADRFSRKRMIYTLDYTSACLYMVIFLILRTGYFNTGLFMVFCLIIGSIDGMYVVAYDSLYPNLITPGCARKAYSISSLIFPLSQCMVPVASFVYAQFGSVTPLFLFNSICFFTAATFETRIRHKETHGAQTAQRVTPQGFVRDFREGVQYVRGEKGLLMIVVLFFFVSVSYGSDTLVLPFFTNNAALYANIPIPVVTLYAIVHSCFMIGRLVGGFLHYTVRYPADKKFQIAIAVYMLSPTLSATQLFLPIPLMMLSFFVAGILTVTSYTIRVTSTQSYVPDEKRGRFNGLFSMTSYAGTMVGQLAAGILAETVGERPGSVVLAVFAALVILLYFWPHGKPMREVYNRAV